MPHTQLSELITAAANKEPDLLLQSTTMTTTTEDSVQQLWSLGAHEIVSIAIIGVSVVIALVIVTLYYIYKFCLCCTRCRKSEDISSKVYDAHNIEDIFVTKASWDRPAEPQIKSIRSNSSIKSFI